MFTSLYSRNTHACAQSMSLSTLWCDEQLPPFMEADVIQSIDIMNDSVVYEHKIADTLLSLCDVYATSDTSQCTNDPDEDSVASEILCSLRSTPPSTPIATTASTPAMCKSADTNESDDDSGNSSKRKKRPLPGFHPMLQGRRVRRPVFASVLVGSDSVEIN